MIFEPQRYIFIWHDAVYSLAVGFVCGFVNRLLSCFMYKGRIRLFIKDVLVSIFFSVMLFSYTVSFANYRVLRWYNTAFAVAGMLLFRPCFDRIVRTVFSLLGVTARHLLSLLWRRAVSFGRAFRLKKAEKYQKITQKTEPEPLHQEDKVLYN